MLYAFNIIKIFYKVKKNYQGRRFIFILILLFVGWNYFLAADRKKKKVNTRFA